MVAVIERASGASLSEEELRAACAGELARYKIPEVFRFLPSLPRNAMGKVVKRELEHLFEGA